VRTFGSSAKLEQSFGVRPALLRGLEAVAKGRLAPSEMVLAPVNPE
jgi:hypothetical protein